MNFDNLQHGDVVKAWDVIGYDGPLWLQIDGGRTLYDQAYYNDAGHGQRVRLDRLVANADGLRVINRYVDPDTPIRMVRK